MRHYTPRQVSAFAFFAQQRQRRLVALEINSTFIASRGKQEDVRKRIKELTDGV